MHQLINEYRPHQSRETLISMMEEQLEKSRKEAEENRAAVRKVDEILRGLAEYDGGGLLSMDMGIGIGNGQENIEHEGRMEDGTEHVDVKKQMVNDGNSWATLREFGVHV